MYFGKNNKLILLFKNIITIKNKQKNTLNLLTKKSKKKS